MYTTFKYFYLFICGAWQLTIHFHCMKKSNVNLQKNESQIGFQWQEGE